MRSIKSNKKYKILTVIIVLLIIIRLILPWIVLKYANFVLAKIPGYFGRVDDINLSLYRGAYIIKDIYINKVDPGTNKETEFFKAPNIDLSVEWKALFHGSVRGELIFTSPILIFTKDKTELNQVKKDSGDFKKLLKDLMPFKVNRFEVNEGEIHYSDLSTKPIVDISLKQVHILANNLTNVVNDDIILPSDITAEADTYGGTVHFNMKLNALAPTPTFDLNTELNNMNLPLLNDFFKAYGRFDVNKGRFGLYSEMAAKDGKFKGYVKPIIKDLDVVGLEDRHNSFIQKTWESLVSVVGTIFKNQAVDQIATKVEIEGSFKNPQVNTIDAIWQVIKNAFIQALLPSIDHQINLNSVASIKSEEKTSILHKIFKSGKKKEKKK